MKPNYGKIRFTANEANTILSALDFFCSDKILDNIHFSSNLKMPDDKSIKESIFNKFMTDGSFQFTEEEVDLILDALSEYKRYYQEIRSGYKSGSRESKQIKELLPLISRTISKMKKVIIEIPDTPDEV